MKSVRILAALAVFAVLSGCGAKKHATVPDELVGVWRTSAPKHADRYFELRESTIVIGTGEGTVSTHFIENVAEAREGDRTLYTIFYVEDGKKYQWSFYYDPARGKSIRLKNQVQMEWRREGDSSP